MNIVDRIKKQISKLETQIEEIQNECSHPKSARKIVNKASTGNYDPHADSYWAEHTCKLCKKEWTEDQ